MNQREYFDADYFERGWTKGTAYTRYSTAGGVRCFESWPRGSSTSFDPNEFLRWVALQGSSFRN